MKALMRETSVRDMASSSDTSMPQTPLVCIAASFDPRSASSSVNHGSNSAFIAVDFILPWSLSKIGTVSTLQPGSNIRLPLRSSSPDRWSRCRRSARRPGRLIARYRTGPCRRVAGWTDIRSPDGRMRSRATTSTACAAIWVFTAMPACCSHSVVNKSSCDDHLAESIRWF